MTFVDDYEGVISNMLNPTKASTKPGDIEDLFIYFWKATAIPLLLVVVLSIASYPALLSSVKLPNVPLVLASAVPFFFSLGSLVYRAAITIGLSSISFSSNILPNAPLLLSYIISEVFAYLVIVPIAILASALVAHFFGRGFGLFDGNFPKTLKAFVSGAAVSFSLIWIPFVGIAAQLLGFFVMTNMLANEHKTSRANAFLAVLPLLFIDAMLGLVVR